MCLRALRRLIVALCLLLMLVGLIPQDRTVAAPTQPNGISYWGMNLYLSKRERRNHPADNLPLLADTARAAGVQWTREELPWDLIEPSNGQFSSSAIAWYDDTLRLAADKGFGIVGMLLTTPAWARDGACRSSYWCPPANVHEYAEFAAWMVERYDGDGYNDSPGSPRIAAWEIWNEPNDTALWPNISSDPHARKRRYGDMLVAAYQSIKAADPSALVLIGGVFIYDGSCAGGICDGFNFLNAPGGVFQQVPAARHAFDVFSIHPYIPTDRPDAPAIPKVITVEGRIRNSRDWLNHPAIGRPDAPIWVTEIGWCTAGNCPGGVRVSEDQQASFLTRAMVIAQQNGVQHTNWFQFEDAFNDSNREWAGAAIVQNYNGAGYPPKPAYHAYRTLAHTLSGAIVAGFGPLHQHNYNAVHDWAGLGSGIYNYRYGRGAAVIDVIWKPEGATVAAFPVFPGKQVTLVDRDGGQQVLAPANGHVQVTIGERPIYLIQDNPAVLRVAPDSLVLLAEAGASSAAGTIAVDNVGSGDLAWSASASGVAIAPSSGTAPATIQVTASTGSRPVGTYNVGHVIVSGANATVSVPVQLKIVSKLHRRYLPIIRR
jgi:hypothetical protein